MRSSPLGERIQTELRAELDGYLDRATEAVAPIFERIALQQSGLHSTQDLQDIASAVLRPLQEDPNVPDRFKIAGQQALQGLIPTAQAEARAAGTLFVDGGSLEGSANGSHGSAQGGNDRGSL